MGSGREQLRHHVTETVTSKSLLSNSTMQVPESLPTDLSLLFESLLDSLLPLTRISTPSFHTLQLIPAGRHAMQESFARDRYAVSVCQTHLENLSSKLSYIASICSYLHQALDAHSNPIHSLPIELLQRVIRFAVESPIRADQVVQLSLVCKRWNKAIFGMSELFTRPNWGRWPSSYVQKWLSHSASRPLECSVASNSTPGTLSVLSLFSSRIPRLKIYLSDDEIYELTALFTKGTMVGLRHLAVKDDRGRDLDLSNAILPALETLYAPEMRIVGPLASSPILESFGCVMHCREEFEAIETILRNLKTITHVSLFASELEGVWEMSGHQLGADNPWSRLKSLRLYGYHDEADLGIASYLRSMQGLELKTLELVNLDTTVLDKVLAELVCSFDLPPFDTTQDELV
ncbi:hypothetical protein DL93DRAFT_159631 [Clavulina sp. PMI_390]|nr:hypothetical protein DL93DRAFT_159631 [Clavulina sp. PMI_390]